LLADAAPNANAFVDGLTTFLGGVGGTIILLMPGYLLAQTYRRGVPGPTLSDSAFVAATAIGGLVSHALALPFTIWLIQVLVPGWPGSALNHYVLVALWVLVVLLALPVVLGAIAAALLTTQLPRPIQAVFNGIGFNRAVRTSDAWTWTFAGLANDGSGRWLRVRLKDGKGTLIGKFGGKSFAASDPAVRDLYLEDVRPVDAHGQPMAGVPNQGVWIGGDQIATIEFY
jgi:Family of unknown function (DUF6338)